MMQYIIKIHGDNPEVIQDVTTHLFDKLIHFDDTKYGVLLIRHGLIKIFSNSDEDDRTITIGLYSISNDESYKVNTDEISFLYELHKTDTIILNIILCLNRLNIIKGICI